MESSRICWTVGNDGGNRNREGLFQHLPVPVESCPKPSAAACQDPASMQSFRTATNEAGIVDGYEIHRYLGSYPNGNINLALAIAPRIAAGVVWVNATNLIESCGSAHLPD